MGQTCRVKRKENMLPLKVLLLSLTFHQFVADLGAFSCPKGHLIKVYGGNKKCQVCPDGYHQPVENHSKQCTPCTKCNEESGSEVKEKCTKETNTKCQCRGGFRRLELDSATCECAVGFGLRHGECSKCEHGFFNRSPNSRCFKWKECTSGVNVSGSSTSDVLCNGEPKTSNTTVSLNTNLKPHRPHEGTQSPDNTHLNTTTATTEHHVLPKDKVQPAPPSNNTSQHIGIPFLIFGIVGLLVLTAVTCKMHVTTCVKGQPAVLRDSVCRRPVEESGDGSCSALKLNPEEP
ncbi:tumor necrosis factor receptor superfamily member 4 [Dunckerocampus dactyliophorus]|uniref:tumor necrosis factor receptor superfamily member 4 n=1 Tax=Dunckerocampus dactyliophorus TaxID=161453 RepID=UPI0024065F38|nr:tumor necrosis factor receptor superfamily member 4 [Dunckerocampus dactyliophorus]